MFKLNQAQKPQWGRPVERPLVWGGVDGEELALKPPFDSAALWCENLREQRTTSNRRKWLTRRGLVVSTEVSALLNLGFLKTDNN